MTLSDAPTDRRDLKTWIITHRSMGVCECCRKARGTEMHEAVVFRGDVMGWQPKSRRAAIFNELNCLLVCRTCHEKLQSDRDTGFNKLAGLYGEEEIRAFVSGLDWKAGVPPNLRRFQNGSNHE